MQTIRMSLAALIAMISASFAAQPQTYPDRPIRLIIPFAPGGTSDLVGRLLGVKLSEELGQTMVIDNRAGAGSTIGTGLAAKAAPDGYTLIVNHNGLAINETLYPKLPYDARKDLAAIAGVGDTPNAVVVNSGLAVKSVKELVALAKKQPGKLDYGSGGHGSTGHLSVALLEDVAGVKFNHIPYKGGGPSVAAVISSQVHFAIPALPTAVPHIKAGRLRILAVTGAARSALMPELPTVAEGGVPGYEFVTWYGIFAPAGTPKNVISRLHQAHVKVLEMRDLREQLAQQGLEPKSSSPQALAQRLQADTVKWARIIKSAGITIE
jgi:tripartite-type tricarboxylate transporter receptor subunit TctC